MILRLIIAGSFIGLLLFTVVNIGSYYYTQATSICDDCFLKFGFPFRLYQFGGFTHEERVILSGLILNLFTSMSVGVAMVWVGRWVKAKA